MLEIVYCNLNVLFTLLSNTEEFWSTVMANDSRCSLSLSDTMCSRVRWKCRVYKQNHTVQTHYNYIWSFKYKHVFKIFSLLLYLKDNSCSIHLVDFVIWFYILIYLFMLKLSYQRKSIDIYIYIYRLNHNENFTLL